MSARKRSWKALYGSRWKEPPNLPGPAKRARTEAAATIQRAWRTFATRRASTFARARRVGNVRTAGLLGIEYKYNDAAFHAGTALATSNNGAGMEIPPSAANWNICSVPQGDASNQRDGRRIVIKQLIVRGQIYWTAVAAQASIPVGQVISIWLVLDTQTNGANCNSEAVFSNTAGANLNGPYSYRNPLYGQRFRILWKKTFHSPPWVTGQDAAGTFSVSSGNSVPFAAIVNNMNLPVTYNGTSGIISEIQDNSIHVMACTTGTTAAPTIQWSARIHFVG